MANSKRKCTGCKGRFDAESMIQLPAGNFHSMDCVTAYAQAKSKLDRERRQAKATREYRDKQKADRVQHRADKRRVNGTAKAEALLAAQLLARLSNADDDGYCTCVSCGNVGMWNEFDGGHFIAKGDSSYWSLDPRNLFPQCKGCNGFGMKHGTALITYTAWMVDRFGQEFVDHMIATKKTVVKRSHLFYEEYLAQAKEEIKVHKNRIGIK